MGRRNGIRRAGALGLILALSPLSACSPDSDTPQVLDGWQSVALPPGVVASSIGVQDRTVLIGGYLEEGSSRAPFLARIRPADSDPTAERVPLTPTTPYGKVADLTSLTASGDEIVALGAARGGAHANVRWTIWTGGSGRLTDRPQAFETFGGWDAGTLLGVATDRRGPLVVGTWQGTHGPDGAIWRAEGERWQREPTDAALANTSDRQVGPRTVDQQTDGSVVVSGSVIDLGAGVHQQAAFWRDTAGAWSLTMLPDPGKRSDTWSTACAQTCWSVGARDDSLAVWSGRVRQQIPALPVADNDSGRVLLGDDRAVVVASTKSTGRLLIGREGRWHSYSAPDGTVLAAALLGARLLLLTDADPTVGRLWTRDLTDVLDR